MVPIEKIIADLMREYDLNQKELAQKFKLSRSTISRYLSGKQHPTLADYEKLYKEWEKYQPICKMF